MVKKHKNTVLGYKKGQKQNRKIKKKIDPNLGGKSAREGFLV